MTDVLFSSLGQLFTVPHMLYMVIGVLIGLIVGIIPGLGGIAGMSLLLPFLYPESVRPAPGSTSNPLTCMAI